jgi:lipopolysaccharide transport system permease protein
MLIQFILFIVIYLYYLYTTDVVHPSFFILLFPFLILQTALFSFAAGLIISVLTAKYRDLEYALQFILRLYLFVTPVIFPMSIVPEKLKIIFWLNPLTSIIETFRISFYSGMPPPLTYMIINLLVTLLMLFIGLSLFIRMEKRVVDYI